MHCDGCTLTKCGMNGLSNFYRTGIKGMLHDVEQMKITVQWNYTNKEGRYIETMAHTVPLIYGTNVLIVNILKISCQLQR